MTRTQPSYRVGDRVALRFGRRTVTGVVSEDRGPIGVRSRRLYQVSVPMDPDEPMTLEMPEEELALAPPGASTIESTKVAEYLANGGLLSILVSNTGGRDQPAVWLCFDVLGNVTYTFYSERGLIGGRRVPFFALHDDKIFTPKRDEVVTYVESFGLTRREAEKVVSEVGTAP